MVRSFQTPIMSTSPTLDPQRASDFFYAFDNYTLFGINVPPEQQAASQAMQNAFGEIFSAFGGEVQFYAVFRNYYKKDPTLADFKQRMMQYDSELTLTQTDTEKLLAQYLDGALPSLDDAIQQAFELFGQGTMFDERRNNAQYGFWSIHGMDSTYPRNPPIGYYGWYVFIRAYSLVMGVEDGDALHLARCVTLAAAIQQLLQPKGVSGPTKTNPNNPPIDPEALAGLRAQYMNLSFTELDPLFGAAPTNSPLGPPPSTMRR